MSSEFSQRPFAAGTVVGLRAFGIGRDRHLTGIVHCLPWTPSENEAICHKTAYSLSKYLAEPHRPASVGCTCGFYAYFDGSNNYAHNNPFNTPTVTGIIEGYGLVTVGSRGFRAEKARIVALIQPDPITQASDCCQCLGCKPLAGQIGHTFGDTFALYPDVPVYANQDHALAAHPLTKPEDVGIAPSQTTLPRSYGPHLHFKPGGYVQAGQQIGVVGGSVADVFSRLASRIQAARTAISDLQQTLNEKTETPVERKRRLAEEAAARRSSARLSNLGGIDRRKRRP